jgi:hypothetical protein
MNENELIREIARVAVDYSKDSNNIVIKAALLDLADQLESVGIAQPRGPERKITTNPRTLLAKIRETIDQMMEGGDIHITTAGVRVDLRSLLGVCDELRAAVPLKLPGQEKVWVNECNLVITDETGQYKTGEMGLSYSGPRKTKEIQVRISSWDCSGEHPEFSKLEGVPVRITIERVPGGSA